MVFSSAVIDYVTSNPPVTNGDIGIAYIYCGFKDREGQTPTKIFASILRQLGFQKPQLPSEISLLDQKFGKQGKTLGLDDVFKATVTLAASFASVFVFFDALNEYDAKTLPNLLALIKTLMETDIRGFVTSRPRDPRIRSAFVGAISWELTSSAEDMEI